MSNPLSLLQQRHSTPAGQLAEPGPEGDALEALLATAVRVPDHGNLTPFRLILLRGEAKLAFGAKLAARVEQVEPDMPPAKREKERTRYEAAPLVIVVVARINAEHKVPVIEQQLGAGCVAYNLLLGAQALGFGAQWLTGWAAYDPEAAQILGLASGEQVIGFVHIGTPKANFPDRKRPALDGIVSSWAP